MPVASCIGHARSDLSSRLSQSSKNQLLWVVLAELSSDPHLLRQNHRFVMSFCVQWCILGLLLQRIKCTSLRSKPSKEARADFELEGPKMRFDAHIQTIAILRRFVLQSISIYRWNVLH